LSRLTYARIIYPGSKLSTYEEVQKFIEPPKFKLHDVYRSLDVIAKEADYIQSALYKNSLKCHVRNSRILFYDCTNFFFELEEENGLKQYGISKEHRPNPIVQLGLFIDGSGIPLAFCINPGNTNEQTTLKPLEKKIIKDFGLSKFVVCTDAGLASTANRVFNNFGDRAFITTQSIKQLKGFLREWALDEKGWRIANNHNIYNLSAINESEHKETIFYKERWINENGLEQRLIVTFSVKTKNYQRKIREEQINRALKLIKNKPKTFKSNQNDYKRLISTMNLTTTGEVAENTIFSLNEELIKKESMYDGYYAICTNLEDDVSEISKINRGRWEIEESFRIMKTDFKVRPVYLSKDERIKAHFVTCFIALLIFRLLEKKLDSKYTCHEIIDALREMNFVREKGEGYIPGFTPTEITNDLHERFGFRLDYEILILSYIKKIHKLTK
jgi:transposase